MGFWDLFRLGKGKLKPELVDKLRAEGLVLCEEGLSATLRYSHFKSPGRRFHGKVVPECVGLAISGKRAVIFARNGTAKLMNSEFTSPHAHLMDISLEDGEKVVILIDYDRAADQPKVSGQIKITVRSPNAPRIVDELRARFGR